MNIHAMEARESIDFNCDNPYNEIRGEKKSQRGKEMKFVSSSPQENGQGLVEFALLLLLLVIVLGAIIVIIISVSAN
ncbi:MAG: hypothetical protein H6Q38_1189 [Chloroflexi bacterium]|jgi:hypothetical protein|nr:hypothetical protein [Chloroflexota bacterium]